MKLYDIPDGSKLMVYANGSKEMQPATFFHLDGMYSLCSLDGVEDGTFHLAGNTPLKKVDDHYEICNIDTAAT